MTFSRRLSRYFFYALLLMVFVACSSGSDDAPSISLSASPDTIAPGESSQLSWTVTGAEPITLSISPDLGIDELTSPVTVSPTETITYTLTASNDEGSRSDSVTITVGAGAITDFAVTTDGLTAAFTWSLAVAEPTGCSLDVGDGSEVRTFDNCLDTQDATHTYASDGSYTATLTLASGESATVMVNVGLGSVEVSGFVDEQSRNVVIILTDEDVEQAGTDLSQLNSAIATVEASLGVTSKAPAIRGMNAAVLGLLQTQQARPGNSTVPLFNFASEFVVAVDSEGEVLATSPLTRLGEEDDEDDSTRKQARSQFDIDIPVEQDVALLIAEPDGRGAWVCKSQLEYQTLEGQRTVTSEQTIYRFPQSLSGTTDLNAGAFQLNELTANPASRTEATSASVMADELPSDEVLAATVSLDDAPAFADGVYQFCNNPDIARNTVTANLDWRSDIFDVVTLPAGASEDLEQGEATVYDYGIALLLDTDTTEDEDGNLITNNRLVGTSPIEADGTLNINLVRSAFDNLDATLFFTDAAFFDAEKRRFPLTPSYQFDATAQTNGTRSTRQGIPDADNIDLGTLDGGLAYISGQVITDQGAEVANANIIMVLDSTRLAFNVATADDTGFYELLIPSGLVDKYILYAQNPEASLAGLASNDDTGSRYEVPEPAIIDQDIILDVPLEEDAEPPQGGTPVASVGDNQQIRLGSTIDLEGSVSLIDSEDDVPRAINLDEGANVSNQDIADLILRWQILEAPEDSTAELTSTDTLTTSFTPDVVGRYRVRFSVFNGETLTADVIILDVFSSSDNTVLFLTPPEYDVDPIFNDSIELTPNEPELVTLERLGSTQRPLTVRFQVSEASTMTADEIIVDGADFDAGSSTFSVTFPQLRSRIAFELIVPAASIDEAPERLTLELVESSVYDTAEPREFRFRVGRGGSGGDDDQPTDPTDPITPTPGFTQADCAGIIVVTTQSELEQLSICTTLGSLIIDSEAMSSFSVQQSDEITSLEPLSNVTEVEGTLLIQNTSLESLTGLENLTSAGDLFILGNASLTSLNGLNQLESISDSLGIGYYLDFSLFPTSQTASNPQLVSLEGLNSLTSVGGFAYIHSNDVLTSLRGLENLQTVRRIFSITGNPSLTSLTGLRNLGAVDTLTIEGNTSLTSLQGIDNLQSIRYLDVIENSSLTSLMGLESVTSVEQGVFITQNDSLVSLQGLNNLQAIGTDSADFLDAGGNLNITSNPQLTSLMGLESLVSVGAGDAILGGSVIIADNDSLTTLVGLTSLNFINGDLVISENDSLNSVASLSNLTTIAVNIRIEENLVLPSLLGLENAVTTSFVEINNNPRLDCSPPPVLRFLSTGIVSSFGNLVNCSDPTNLTLPNITNFSAEPPSIEAGQSSTLSWTVDSDLPVTLTITPDVGDVSGLSSVFVTPTETTEYTLTAENADGVVTLPTTITVTEPELRDCPGNRSARTQAEVEALSICRTIEGGLFLTEDTPGAITSLEPLSNLEAVGIDVRLDSPSPGFSLVIDMSATSLTGLENLRSIPGNVAFDGNDSLTNFEGLSNLETIGGSFVIGTATVDADGAAIPDSLEGNDALINFVGLESLTTIGGNFNVVDNASLQDFTGLENLETVGGVFNVVDNASLQDFTGLENLETVGGTFRVIGNNNSLQNLDGLPALASIGGRLFIGNQPALTSIDGFNNLLSVGEGIVIVEAPELESLNGFGNLTTLGDSPSSDGTPFSIFFQNLPNVPSIASLSSLTTLSGGIYIDNLGIGSLNGLQGITNFDNANVVNIRLNANLDCSLTPNLPFVVDFGGGNFVNCN